MAGPIRIAILANGSQARREIGQTEAALGRFGRGAGRIAAAAGLGGLAAGIVGIGKSAVQLEAQFGKTMNIMQATSNASGRQMENLRKLAMKMGADTVFSANDAAQAMLELSRGGIRPAEIRAGALKSALTLAAAGELEMGEAANVMVKAMGQFSIKGRQAGQVAAALAGGANASSASVRDMAFALAQSGLAADSVGFSIQETTAVLAAFSKKGLEGSDAGTALKTMLDRLQPSTDKAKAALEQLGVITDDGRNRFLKANGEFQSAARIAEVLRQGTVKLDAAERKRLITQAFGSDAQRAATIFARNGAEGINALTKATSDQRAAQKQANAAMGGTAGVLERISGAWETARLQLGQKVAPAVTKIGNAFADNLGPAMETAIRAGERLADAFAPAVSGVATAIRGLSSEGETAAGVFDVLVGSIRVASEIVGGVARAFDALPDPLKSIVIQAGIAALVLPRLASGFTAVAGQATAAGASMVGFGQKLAQNRAAMTYQTTAIGKAREALHGFGGAARGAAGIGGMVGLAQASQQSNVALKALGTTASGALIGFSAGGPIGAAIGAGAGGLAGLAMAFTANYKAAGLAKVAAHDFAATLDQSTGAIQRETRELALNALQKAKATSAGQDLGLSTRDLIGATLGQAGATRKVQEAIASGARGTDIQAAAARNLQRVLFGVVGGLEGSTVANTGLTRSFASQRGAVIGRARDLQTYREALQGLPKKAFVELKNLNFDPTKAQIVDLTKKYDLTPKQVRTLVQALGTGKARGEILSVRDALRQIHDKTITVTTIRRLVNSVTTKNGGPSTRPGANDLNGLLGGSSPRTSATDLFAPRGRTAGSDVQLAPQRAGVQVTVAGDLVAVDPNAAARKLDQILRDTMALVGT